MSECDKETYRGPSDNNGGNLSPHLMKAINKIIEDEGFVTYSINVTDLSTEGANFMSLLKEVNIKGETVANNKEMNLFVKQRLADSDKNVLSSDELFSKEIFTYSELANLFNELQNEFNLPNNEKYYFVKYYNKEGDDSLIFDNMTMKGFRTCSRFEAMPLKAMELSVKHLAKFHAFSMVLKLHRPDFYEKKIQTMKFPFKFNDSHINLLISTSNISMAYLDDSRKKSLEQFLPDIVNRFYRYIHENEGNTKCLCHGDYRTSNILIKEMNGETAQIIAIDYQAVNYNSPVIDLFFLIFLSTDQQFRKEHLENLKKLYFESFTKYLELFDIDVELVYSKKEFENDFKNQLEYGLMVSLFFLPFILPTEDDVPEVTNELKTMSLHSNFKQRIEEIVDDYIEWGYL